MNAYRKLENKIKTINPNGKGMKVFNVGVTILMVVVTAWGSFVNGWISLSNLMSWLGLIGVIGIAYRSKANFFFNMSQNVVGFIVNARTKLFGDAAMSAFYFFSQIFGIKNWNDHTDEDKGVVTHSRTNWKLQAVLIFVLSVGIGVLSWVLGGNFVILDSVNNASAIIAQIMHMTRNKNSWVVWTFTNVIGVYMFASLGVYQVAIMYLVFIFNNVRGWVNWTVRGEKE